MMNGGTWDHRIEDERRPQDKGARRPHNGGRINNGGWRQNCRIVGWGGGIT